MATKKAKSVAPHDGREYVSKTIYWRWRPAGNLSSTAWQRAYVTDSPCVGLLTLAVTSPPSPWQGVNIAMHPRPQTQQLVCALDDIEIRHLR